MTDNWKDRLKKLIDSDPNLTMKGLSVAAGLSETAVRDILVRSKTSQIDNILAIAKAAKIDPCMLLLGEASHQTVPITGEVLGDEKVIFPSSVERMDKTPQQFWGSVAVETGSASPLAVIVRTNDLAPAYYDGDVIIASKLYGVDIENVIGRECIVSLAADHTGVEETYLMYVVNHTHASRYTLRSSKFHIRDMGSVELEWAAPVNWVKRRNQFSFDPSYL